MFSDRFATEVVFSMTEGKTERSGLWPHIGSSELKTLGFWSADLGVFDFSILWYENYRGLPNLSGTNGARRDLDLVLRLSELDLTARDRILCA